MSGFDEGGVYYSDQQFVSAGAAADEAALPSRAQALSKFGEFIRTFQIDPKSGAFPYADQLARRKDSLRVDIGHLSHPVYGAPELATALVDNPAEYLPIFEQAARQESQRIQNLMEDGSDPEVKEVQVMLFKSETSRSRVPHVSMRDIKPEAYVSKLVIVPGIITAASRPKHKATYLTIQCKECKATKRIACRPGVGGAMIPRMCDAAALPGQSNQCGTDPYIVLADKSECVDQQTLKMQERPEDVPTGDLPRSMMCLVDRRLVGSVSPGTRVTAVGILSIFQGKDGGGNQRDKAGAVAIRQPYLRVIGFQEDVLNGDTARRPTFSLEEEVEFKEFAAQPGAMERIFARIAPQIFGSPDIKKAIASLLFGGARKRMPDGTYRRGDINVLLLGDPSTAKSQFLKFTSKTAPIAVYTSGKGSSAAGLTASVIRTISIAKAGITTMLRSRTSVLAAANPPSGRYDDLKSAQENIDLQSTILSRFDLIFIVKDERSVERDMQIARHVLDVHRLAGAQPEADEEEKREEAFLKRYIEYCRQSCSPRITDSAAKLLANEYVELRAESKRAASADGSDIPAIPVTVRQLEAVIRIAESLAKMNLQTVATEAHVRQALELFKISTMDAVKSGLMDVAVFTDEQRQEIHRVEEQIKRRVAIGSFVSERKLVDELVRVGFNENLVRKGLMFLQTTGDFEYRRERRLVHRMK
ncbi:hypothetical protein CHLNCDRAFT_34202 [Chlorella variabilis]|uniref:DNA replication licensing factor MCM5 n=1 Tax=Chlorella variabilis TaxID=554065 RepID=E1Z644_CHLVA|nr:hypothetical protein CHLNCDRAFT_34202 [Chlorella variabilis]EFN58868.1 hypothetical protein CHLNCDRAFT_34202 [Chlorella variabilis]|eukprot:XP_005850970.1 hypothetical protein CHLNCDRAFT_34202 [Chlorella variabilis]